VPGYRLFRPYGTAPVAVAGPPKKMKMARTNIEWVALAFGTWVFR
jgi:hypothetical protein